MTGRSETNRAAEDKPSPAEPKPGGQINAGLLLPLSNLRRVWL